MGDTAHKILIVDDDPLTLKLLERHLAQGGYQSVSAKNGREAVALAQQEKPDVIVMDVMMPQINGLEALGQLKSSEATKAIPVLIISSNHDPSLKQESENAGAAALLAKPVGAGLLLETVRRLLSGAPAGA
jgi:CheY-like chemotaxis protein